jgi:hypothetical protein
LLLWKQLGHKFRHHSAHVQILCYNWVCRACADPNLVSNFSDGQTTVLQVRRVHILNDICIPACWWPPWTCGHLWSG